MLTIKTFTINPIEVNCYVVSDETKEAVIIDPGFFSESEWSVAKKYIADEGLSVKHCLLTHAHFDHIMGCYLVEKDINVLPTCHVEDAELYNGLDKQVEFFLGPYLQAPKQPVLGKCVNDGCKISFGTHVLEVLHTPGHSKGCVCFYCSNESILFSGDTLFCGGMGRTDLEGGNYSTLMKSLARLSTLPECTTVYPGHGTKTTIANEKKCTLPTYSK